MESHENCERFFQKYHKSIKKTKQKEEKKEKAGLDTWFALAFILITAVSRSANIL